MEALFVLVLLGLVITINALMGGAALSLLWGWFVVPTFHLPALGIVPAIGIGIMVSFLTYQEVDVETKQRDTGETIGHLFSMLVGRPLFVIFLGLIVHSFM